MTTRKIRHFLSEMDYSISKFKTVIGAAVAKSSNLQHSASEVRDYEPLTNRKRSFKKQKRSVDTAKLDSLEKAVFGGSSHFMETQLADEVSKKKRSEDKRSVNEEKKTVKPKAAWVDSGDEEEELSTTAKMARKTLTVSNDGKSTKWAETLATEEQSKSELNDEDDIDEGGFGTSVDRIALPINEYSQLPWRQFMVTRCNNLNKDKPSESQLCSVRFHQDTNLALVAGYDTLLNLFRVGGQVNSNAASIILKDFPIHQAEFVPNKNTIMATSLYKLFYLYDLSSMTVCPYNGLSSVPEKVISKFKVSSCGQYIAIIGSYGSVYLLQSKNFYLINKLTLNDYVEAVSFSNDSRFLICCDRHGFVYIYDLKKMPRCILKFQDHGSTNTCSLALSREASLLACGSFKGILNLYDFQSILDSKTKFPEPIKFYKNLTSIIDNITFNCCSEFCLFSTRLIKNSVKAVHLESLKVFSDFPAWGQFMGEITTLDISPNSKYMAFGSKKGKATLFDINFYNKY